jgi:hypothetical protein
VVEVATDTKIQGHKRDVQCEDCKIGAEVEGEKWRSGGTPMLLFVLVRRGKLEKELGKGKGVIELLEEENPE